MKRFLLTSILAIDALPALASEPSSLAHGHNPIAIGMFLLFVASTLLITRWAARRELNLFTGRTRQEFSYTFDKWPAARLFRTVITMDDAKKKPNPEGLRIILAGRNPKSALYVGDNVDDALAGKAARIPFIAVLSAKDLDYRERARRFRQLGALALVERARDLSRLLV